MEESEDWLEDEQFDDPTTATTAAELPEEGTEHSHRGSPPLGVVAAVRGPRRRQGTDGRRPSSSCSPRFPSEGDLAGSLHSQRLGEQFLGEASSREEAAGRRRSASLGPLGGDSPFFPSRLAAAPTSMFISSEEGDDAESTADESDGGSTAPSLNFLPADINAATNFHHPRSLGVDVPMRSRRSNDLTRPEWERGSHRGRSSSSSFPSGGGGGESGPSVLVEVKWPGAKSQGRRRHKRPHGSRSAGLPPHPSNPFVLKGHSSSGPIEDRTGAWTTGLSQNLNLDRNALFDFADFGLTATGQNEPHHHRASFSLGSPPSNEHHEDNHVVSSSRDMDAHSCTPKRDMRESTLQEDEGEDRPDDNPIIDSQSRNLPFPSPTAAASLPVSRDSFSSSSLTRKDDSKAGPIGQGEDNFFSASDGDDPERSSVKNEEESKLSHEEERNEEESKLSREEERNEEESELCGVATLDKIDANSVYDEEDEEFDGFTFAAPPPVEVAPFEEEEDEFSFHAAQTPVQKHIDGCVLRDAVKHIDDQVQVRFQRILEQFDRVLSKRRIRPHSSLERSSGKMEAEEEVERPPSLPLFEISWTNSNLRKNFIEVSKAHLLCRKPRRISSSESQTLMNNPSEGAISDMGDSALFTSGPSLTQRGASGLSASSLAFYCPPSNAVYLPLEFLPPMRDPFASPPSPLVRSHIPLSLLPSPTASLSPPGDYSPPSLPTVAPRAAGQASRIDDEGTQENSSSSSSSRRSSRDEEEEPPDEPRPAVAMNTPLKENLEEEEQWEFVSNRPKVTFHEDINGSDQVNNASNPMDDLDLVFSSSKPISSPTSSVEASSSTILGDTLRRMGLSPSPSRPSQSMPEPTVGLNGSEEQKVKETPRKSKSGFPKITISLPQNLSWPSASLPSSRGSAEGPPPPPSHRSSSRRGRKKSADDGGSLPMGHLIEDHLNDFDLL